MQAGRYLSEEIGIMKDFAIIAFYLMALPAQDVAPVKGSAFHQSLREAGVSTGIAQLGTASGLRIQI